MTKKEIFSAIKEASSVTGVSCHPLITSSRYVFMLVAGSDYIALPYRSVKKVDYGVDYIFIHLPGRNFVKLMRKFNIIQIL